MMKKAKGTLVGDFFFPFFLWKAERGRRTAWCVVWCGVVWCGGYGGGG